MRLQAINFGAGLLNAVAVLCCLWLLMPSASASEHLDDFSATYKINADASVLVSELWRYDFGLLQRNDIERLLPMRYFHNGTGYNVTIQSWSVVDEDGQILDSVLNKRGDDLQIRIQSGERPFSGSKIFNISYRLHKAVVIEDNKATFNWNVTGGQWGVGIVNATARVELAELFTVDRLSSNCSYGASDALVKCLPKTTTISGSTQVDFVSPRTLYPGEALNISATFPKGAISSPSLITDIEFWVKENWPLAVPFLSFLSSVLWWLRSARDPRRYRIYGVRFSPPDNLSPLEVGYIYKNTLDLHDLAAEIFYLAAKGYLGIELTGSEQGADYRLTRHRVVSPMSYEHQRLILDSLFNNRDSVLLSVYLKEIPLRISELEEGLKSELGDKSIIKANMRMKKFIVALAWLILGSLGWLAASVGRLGSVAAISFLSSGVLIAIVALLRSGWSRHWLEAMEHIKGFERYLSVREDNARLIHNAPVRNPELFENYLAYALVLGVERLWAAQFEGLVMSTPDWFANPYWQGEFNPHILSDDLATLAMVVAGQIPIIST